MNENNRKKLEQLIRDYPFTHAREYLLDKTRQGIRLEKAGSDDYADPCASRVGGDPDLPMGHDWPMTADSVPMTFLAQLNLQDLASHDHSSMLPTNGMLFFFVGIDEPAYNIQHRVLFLREEELVFAERRVAPEMTALKEQFNAFRLEARASLEPPNYAYVDFEQIENDEYGYEDYEDFTFEVTGSRREDVAMMFGYPDGQHDDSEYEAALMILTGKPYNYDAQQALQHIADHFAGDRDRAEQEIRDVVLLLEIESDNDIGFCWWDAGALQFFIRKEDLLAGRFDRTYCSLYSS
ncbi:YwqG family protein [Brevibacillus brevis]|uniref:YwqG family protein n=1 Tax=Brevibacillus brevis TaxID=1393 RepID=A0ABY9T888_BREBE|nr:YwqG family protein [Brevibacillus brevis]WNC16300.1 YwqG family protein [Brevibacillus brevis]